MKEHVGGRALGLQVCEVNPSPPGPLSPSVFAGIRLTRGKEMLTAVVPWKAC